MALGASKSGGSAAAHLQVGAWLVARVHDQQRASRHARQPAGLCAAPWAVSQALKQCAPEHMASGRKHRDSATVMCLRAAYDNSDRARLLKALLAGMMLAIIPFP